VRDAFIEHLGTINKKHEDWFDENNAELQLYSLRAGIRLGSVCYPETPDISNPNIEQLAESLLQNVDNF